MSGDLFVGSNLNVTGITHLNSYIDIRSFVGSYTDGNGSLCVWDNGTVFVAPITC